VPLAIITKHILKGIAGQDLTNLYPLAHRNNMKDSSIDSRYRDESPELAKQSDKQLADLDQHSAGALPDEVEPVGIKSHGFGVAIPEQFKKRPEKKAPAKAEAKSIEKDKKELNK
jgi:hypothetical protein